MNSTENLHKQIKFTNKKNTCVDEKINENIRELNIESSQEAVLAEFTRINDREGVLGAMETQRRYGVITSAEKVGQSIFPQKIKVLRTREG